MRALRVLPHQEIVDEAAVELLIPSEAEEDDEEEQPVVFWPRQSCPGAAGLVVAGALIGWTLVLVARLAPPSHVPGDLTELSASEAAGTELVVDSDFDGGSMPFTADDARVSSTWGLRARGTGCSNWQENRLEPAVIMKSPEQCRLYCAADDDCVGFHYQSKDLPSCAPVGTFGRGACYKWKAACKSEVNECWDDYVMVDRSASLTPSWIKIAGRTGCSNWKEIKLEPVLATAIGTTGGIMEERPNLTDLAAECGAQCRKHAKCVGFGYETAPREECADGTEGVEVGACYLWADECDFMENNCWNHYRLYSATEMCEGHSYTQDQCKQIGCCRWDSSKCVSANGEGLCHDLASVGNDVEHEDTVRSPSNGSVVEEEEPSGTMTMSPTPAPTLWVPATPAPTPSKTQMP